MRGGGGGGGAKPRRMHTLYALWALLYCVYWLFSFFVFRCCAQYTGNKDVSGPFSGWGVLTYFLYLGVDNSGGIYTRVLLRVIRGIVASNF